MDYKFSHSLVVLRHLARDTARTPPSEDDPPFEYVDRSLTILGRTFDMHGERMRQEFLGQRDFIANQFQKVDERFKEVEKKMDERFKEVEKKMDERFKEVEKKMDGRFKEVDERFEELDKKMRQRLDDIQKASRNFLRTRGWEAIYRVGTFDAQGGIHTPEYFPSTVKRFWGLKDSSQMDRLIYLIRFYNIQGYEEWGMDADSLEGDSDWDESGENSSKLSRSPIPLEVAVRSNPEIAHRALAAELGLSYDGIQRFMERAQEFSQTQATKHNKRRQNEQTPEESKRRSFKRSPEEEGTEVTSPTEPFTSQERSR